MEDEVVARPSKIKDICFLPHTSNQEVASTTDGDDMTQERSIRKHVRTRIPNRPNVYLNLWSFMKNCIGKELSKIAMPVNFNEPLSMTQRITEELEYSTLLDSAACCESSLEQICYVAAFSIAAYSSTALRCSKPFNPMLGETYECDRTFDMGWRSFTEQVSHHPPSVAQHAEGRGWTLWQNFTMSSKFRGKYLLVTPLGTSHCTFANSDSHYTWKKVTTTVNNIILGRLWIDQSGEMDVVNHTTGEKCHIKYHPYSYFSRDAPKKVSGIVYDKNGNMRYVLSGIWDQSLNWAKVVSKEVTSDGIAPTEKTVQTSTLQPIWTKTPALNGAKHMYHFSPFTCSLNQPEENVAPTDSRLRPDMRLMENQDFDSANRSKLQLEENQRARRKMREAEKEAAESTGIQYEGYKPTWFEYSEDPLSDIGIFVYKGGYWESKEVQDWSMCKNIYLESPS